MTSLRVIVVGPLQHPELVKEAFAAGITAIVTKPFDPPDLYRVIQRYIR